MKTTQILTFFIFIFAVAFASAAEAQLTLDKVSLQFGNEDQRASNPNHDDVSRRNVNVTMSVTLSNPTNATGTISNIQRVFSGTITDTRFQAVVTGIPQSLAPDESAAVQVIVRVPEDLDAVDANLDPLVHAIGSLKFTYSLNGSSGESATLGLKMQRENQLKYDQIEFYVDDRRVTLDADDDGDEVRDIHRKDDIRLCVTVKNEYRDREDTQIESVEVEVNVDGDLDDLDDTLDYNDLDTEEETEECTDTEQVPDDAKDETNDLELLLSGTDEHGAFHGVRRTHDLEVEVPNDEVSVQAIRFSPTSLRCTDTSFRVTVGIENTGRSDQRRPSVAVEVAELAFRERLYDDILGELDESDDTSATFIVPIVKDDLTGQTLRVEATTYYDRTTESDKRAELLTTPDCTIVEPKPVAQQDPDPVVVVQPPVTQPPVVTPPVVTPSDNEPVSVEGTDTAYLALLGVAVLVLIVIIVVLVAKMASPKRGEE